MWEIWKGICCRRDDPYTDVEGGDGGGDGSPRTWTSERDGHLEKEANESESADRDPGENANLKRRHRS